MRSVLTAVVTVITVLLAPGAASAGTVSIQPLSTFFAEESDQVPVVVFQGDGSGDSVRVTGESEDVLGITDETGEPITLDPSADGGCTVSEFDPGSVSCLAEFRVVAVDLQGGRDTFVSFTEGRLTLAFGGAGDDSLRGSTGNDILLGEGGADTMKSFAGDDLLDGGEGDDVFDAETTPSASFYDGADRYVGGPGFDRLLHTERKGDTSWTFDGQANDGLPEEGDDVDATVEELFVGAGNDTMVGDDGPNKLIGGDGRDVIRGAGGDDDLNGAGGDDEVRGEAGDDEVDGGGDADLVVGGPGKDQLRGELCVNGLTCFHGPDRIEARDGEVDAVSCGGGADTAVLDAGDVLDTDASSCEAVDREAAPGGGGGPAPGGSGGTTTTPGGGGPTTSGGGSTPPPGGGGQPTTPGGVITPAPGTGGTTTPGATTLPSAVLPKTLRRAGLRQGTPVRVSCAAACSVTLELRAGRKGLLARARGTRLKAGTVALRLRLSAKGRRAVGRRGRLAANLVLVVRDADGKAVMRRTTKVAIA